MSGSLGDVPCASFEANVFAKSLCQHCFRAAGAHQHANQEHAVEVAGRSAGPDAEPGGPWDAVRIVAPRCEVYVCVGRADGAARPRACCPHCRDLPCLVSQDWEMTRLWDSSLGSAKRDAMSYRGLKDEVRAPQADRPRWGQPLPSGSWVRTEAPSFRREICPLKADRGPASQKPEESRAKHRTGSCYFSLEHRKPDPPRAPSPPHPSRGSSLTPAGRPLASSSRAGEPHGHPGVGGTEGRRGLERQEYTVLADLPKPKRLGHGDAADRCGSRTLSPGRVEVERIFGCERRKSETLEAFQALEEGRVERLDGKTPVPPSKGRLGRRQSSPSLPREGQRLSWHPEQRSRDPKEPRRSPSPARHPERTRTPLRPTCPSPRAERDWKKPRESLSPTQQLERGSSSPRFPSPTFRSERRAGGATSPPQRSEKDWRSQAERGRAAWQAGSVGKATERKSWGDSLHPLSFGKGSDSIRLGQARPPQSTSLLGRTESTWKNQKEISPAGPARGAERRWGNPGELLHARGSGKQPECGWQSLREKLQPPLPGKGTDGDWRGRGKPLRPMSPTRPLEQDWKGRGDAYQAQKPEKDSKPQEKPLCHVDLMHQLEKDWRSPGRCLDVWPRPDDSWRRPESPVQQLEDDWKATERTQDSNNPEKPLESDWGSKKLPIYHPQLGGGTFPAQSSSGSQHPHPNAGERRNKPDLLNFKKGWMSILDEPGEWKKHWFVLTDSSLRYYRDSNAEEADDLDGEIDLRSCTDVTEFAVQRNYGFQIHTKDAIFTLSAMTSGIRRNWIEALRKNVRPVSAPDVTKLSDCNKENSIRNCVPTKGSLRAEEQQRPGSEGSAKGSPWKADGQRHAFDYVELSPLQQDPHSQGSPPRTRGSLRVSERAPRHEDLERDLALRSEERRKWFESPDGGVPSSDGLGGDSSRKAGELDLPTAPLSEEQRARLNEEIEKKWLELERLPLKDSRRVPLTALLNQGKGSQGDPSEALRKEVQSLRAQLESCRAKNESLREATKSQGDGHVPRGYISQEACERSLAEMESSHQQVMEELQRHHQRELERLRQEKERLLAEEAAATAAAIEALKKAHREEMNKELGRTRSFQQCGSISDALQKQHQSDVDSLKRELQVLSEQYSQKCLEIGQLTEKAEEREQTLQRCQQEGKQLLRKNQELQTRLSDEIGKLRSFISSRCSGDGSQNNERSSCELEVLLRVKENELQYVKKEVQCLREELQMMQKDKRFASGKYQDVYAELNHIKVRSEREIEQLKEHLRLAMAALQEKESLCNSLRE
ncbi:TRIO and F-actin-binding protein isoform X2 [Oxyura jamaicensis]|uniref:TRIO and F-actin-binding protein isoform X2 n=1 Tax=Oxyura jamaicensis TaxID=8884 RepID=UPI0015A50EC0|nr:TRIO and F-actin-binding protein isoform X2 [Oxyura jamaicensis]